MYSWMRKQRGKEKNHHCSINALDHEAAPTQIRRQHLCSHEKETRRESPRLPSSAGETLEGRDAETGKAEAPPRLGPW